MQEGRLEMEGSASEVVGRYVASVQHLMHQPLGERKDRNGNGTIRFTEVECRNARGEVVSTVSGGEELLVALSYESRHPVSTGVMHAYITFVNQFGTALINCGNSLVRTDLRGLPASGKVVCRIPRFPLVPGTYSLTVVLIVNGQTADKVRDAAMLHVIEGDYFGSGKLPDPGYASVMVDHRWFAE
jgi:lipopolysaccharide transport system ATP-binding protein